MNGTYHVCGQCGAIRTAEAMVIVSETDITGKQRTGGGFLGIRCKEHPHAEQLARRAVRRHLATVARRYNDALAYA